MTTTENAPGAGGNQPEGTDQKPAEDSIWSKATRRSRAAAALPGTVAADHRVAIQDVPTADAEVGRPTGQAKRRHTRLADHELRALPLIIRRTEIGRRSYVWRTADGHWWRRGGTIRIQRHPRPDGERAFIITLWKGANSDDLRFMLQTVERARRGEDFDLFWDLVAADWADEHTYQSKTSRPYGDPHTMADHSGRPVICDEPLCGRLWHDSDEALHELDAAQGPGYSVSVNRFLSDRDWHVYVGAQAELSEGDLAGFMNDLQWMRTECEKANAGRTS